MLVASTVLAVFFSPAVGASADNAGGKKAGWVLTHHSFVKTLSYDDKLGDWLASAGTMALRDRLQILPPVPDRYGLFWNRKAAKTQNFELTFNFRAFPEKKAARDDGTFAFWLSPDNFTASYDEQAVVNVRNWTLGLEQAGLSLLSNSPSFRGLGVVFASLDKKGSARPSVCAVIADGKSPLTMQDFPAAIADSLESKTQQTKYVDWRTKEVEVKISASNGIISGTLQASKSGSAVEIFRMNMDWQSMNWQDVFFGFSGYSGSQSFLELDMSRIEMRNLDTQTMGEEVPEEQDEMLSEMEDPERWKAMLEEEKRYIDQRSQGEAVVRLTKLLTEHVEKYNKMGDRVKSELLWLEKRMDSLNAEVGLLIGESKAIKPETGKVDVSTVVSHIVGIRSILSKGTQEDKLEAVHASAKSLKEKGGSVLSLDGRVKVAAVAEQAKAVEKHVTQGTSQTSFLVMILILAVCGLGVLFLNRMRYYEKKHYI
jgi:hypothetical protein